MADLRKLGGEFLVNTETDHYQMNPTITGLSNGGFVVSWEDKRFTFDDADNYNSVKAQVFDASGAKVGSEFLVNTTTARDQGSPTITGLSTGGFVVSWTDTSRTGGDASSASVKAQLFDASGVKVGAEFLVNTETANFQGASRITGLSNGGFVVSWMDASGTGGDADGNSVKAQVFDAAGAKVGTEFLVNTETVYDQGAPTITRLSGGGFVVSWEDNSGRGGDVEGQAVKAQVFDSSGTKVGTEFLVNTETADYQERPTITALSNGNFVVSWQDLSGKGGDADGYGVKAQIFDASGTKVGTEFLINTETTDFQMAPTITGLSNGGFVVSWTDLSHTGGDASRTSVKAQVFDASGTKVGAEFLVNTETTGDQDAPTITGLSNGGFVVSWQDASGKGGDASGSGIKAQIFTFDAPAPGVTLTKDTGASATDAVTKDASLTISGIEKGATLSYVVDGGAASATYDPTKLSDGQHTVSVAQIDRNGKVSQAGTLTFTLDTVAPEAPSATLAIGTDTPTASLSGKAAPGGGAVAILDGGVELARVTADASTGAYGFDFGTLNAGTHRLVAAITDQAGNTSRTAEQVVAVGTGADIASKLDALSADKGLSAICITDGARLVFTSVSGMEHARQFDAAALAKIVGSYGFQVVKVVGGSNVVTLYDTDGHLTQRTTTRSAADYTIDRYDAANKLASQTYVHDGLREEKEYGIADRYYQRQEAVYDADDKQVSVVRYYADGNKMAFSSEREKDGSQTVKEWTREGALTVNHLSATGAFLQQERYEADGKQTYQEVRYADGSKATHVFDPVSGEELRYALVSADRSRTETLYHIQGKDYAEQTQSYDAAGHITDGVRKYADGTVSFTETYKADGSTEIHRYDAAARETEKLSISSDGSKDHVRFTYEGSSTNPTTATQSHMGANCVKQWSDVTAADGSHAQTAHAAGVTLVSHETVADIFTGFKGGADTFVFASGCGKDVVKGFEAGPHAHDVLAIDDSYARDFASLQAKMTMSGSDTLITLDAENSILLKNVDLAAITTDDVRFFHDDVMLI